MEIDLNHAVTEVESNAFCSGDCDNSSSSLSSNSSSRSPSKSAFSIYQELWHACAGTLNSLPKKGNVVVYFPQGHLEHAASASPFPPPLETPTTFDLQPQIICRVVNVQLLANKENDEVYTQVALLPQPEVLELNLEGKEGESVGQDEGGGGSFTESTPHMFCKTLTASDTSTHGGFSVPRRAAEDCFPPLDHGQQRPSQELVAKDLHGVEWRFRHIYRGRPRRHLLTTGWSYFVSQKNLVSGDAVLFLRGEGGELRLGIRRAVRPRNGLPDSIYGSLNSCASVLSLVAGAISNRSMFHVFYSPRASHPEFIIPFQKYMKSIVHSISTGMRFKMKLHIDDSPERRCSGVVTGICDLDPFRWPNSKWRCLMVKWEEDLGSYRQERFSPWEIDPSDSIPPPLNIQSSPKLKKLRTIQTAPPNNPVSGGVGFSDFEDSVRSSKVLQGQENAGFVSPLYRRDNMNQLLDFHVQQPSARQNVTLSGIPKASISEFIGTPAIYAGFSESGRFPKVLQGQEICPLRSLKGNAGFNPSPWVKHGLGCHFINMHPRSKPNIYPLASESFRDLYYSHNDVYKASEDCVMPSHTNGFARDNMLFNMPSLQSTIMRKGVGSLNLQNEKIAVESVPVPPTSVEKLNNPKDDAFVGSMAGCKLFGFSLNGETPPNSQSLSKRSCTKVHKQGNLVGRAIDLSRLNGYDDLLIELEGLFGMEGQLCDSSKGWQILYTDSENDMMAVGDDPWHEFCDVVCKIHIHTQEEVKNMTAGLMSDDTQSCLEEAPAIIE